MVNSDKKNNIDSEIQVSAWDVFRNLWKYVRNYKLHVFLILFGIAVSSALSIGEFYVYKIFIDEIAEFASQRTNEGIFFNSVLAVLLIYFFVKIGGRLIFSNVTLLSLIKLDINVRTIFLEAVFSHLHALSMRFHSDKRTGSILKKIHRGESGIVKMLDALVFNILPVLTMIIFFIILLLYFDWRISLVTILTLIIYIVWIIVFNNRLQKFVDISNKSDDKAQGIAADSVINYETVKYFTNENYENFRFRKRINEWNTKEKKAWTQVPLYIVSPQDIIFISGSIIILYLAVINVISGAFTVGDVALVGGYLANIRGLMHGLSMGYFNVRISMTDQKEIIKVLKEKPEVEEIKNSVSLKKARGDIEYRNVSFAYGDENVIKNFSLKIKTGEKVAFVGSSGVGKSTLIVQLLPRFYDIQKGQIFIDGVDITSFSLKSLRRNIAIVPQESVLFNDTIYNNILYGRTNAKKSEVKNASKKAYLDNFIGTLPKGYNTLVGERGVKLSGGQKQRVGIARAILADSPILILDEATSSLDSKIERVIQKSLHNLMKNRTTLIIAHRLSTVSSADKIVVLDKGRIVDIGDHKELLKRSKIYKELWNIQAGGFTV